jgi:hypothetical protein
MGRQAEKKGTTKKKEPKNSCSTLFGYILPNILLHHCPGGMVDHD